MTLNDYQIKAKATAVYPSNSRNALMYTSLGLASEAGEVAGKVKKLLRDAVWSKDAMRDELGDVLWYVSALAGHIGYTLEEVAQANIDKLADRKERNRIQGSGDYR